MIGSGVAVVLAMHQTELFAMSDHLVVMADGNKTEYNAKYTFNGINHLFPTFAATWSPMIQPNHRRSWRSRPRHCGRPIRLQIQLSILPMSQMSMVSKLLTTTNEATTFLGTSTSLVLACS
jgi:hypothetical protein